MSQSEQQDTIQPNTVVHIHYTLTGDDKKVIDSSRDSDPLPYLHGHGQIVRGLENALAGKRVGDKVSVRVSPEEGYGHYDAELVQTVGRDEFPEGSHFEVGAMFEAAGPNGEPFVIRITEINGDEVVVDGNHPLAGQHLNFDVEVITIRQATTQELEHGHVHEGDDDCH